MSLKIACVLTTGLASAAVADVVMDFDAYEFANDDVNDIGETIQEDGFTLSKGPNEPFPFAVFGQQSNNYPGSAAPFNNTNGGLIHLEQDDGQPFDMVSMLVANLGGGGPTVVEFVGFKEGGGTVEATFTHSGQGPVFEQFDFPDTFAGLAALEWTQDSPFHQFDKITIVPGPGAIALLGLGGLAAIRRRR